tara:strand:+ start:79 stop:363 length:285 start_codon:yes stop_codon:yes gene_type:complete
MNLIGTGNQIGQSIALMRLVVAIIVGCCFCSIGAAIFTKKPDDNNNPKRSGMILMSVGGCAILLAYLTYIFTKSFKGAGTMYTAFSTYDAMTKK